VAFGCSDRRSDDSNRFEKRGRRSLDQTVSKEVVDERRAVTEQRGRVEKCIPFYS